ncbi:hypothetical protein [Devosia sp. DBB001]|nr:hypothetical protein [Devosia sp. DBB001]
MPCEILISLLHESSKGFLVLAQELRRSGCLTVSGSAVEHLRGGITHRATVSPFHLTRIHYGGFGKQSDQIIDFPRKLGR